MNLANIIIQALIALATIASAVVAYKQNKKAKENRDEIANQTNVINNIFNGLDIEEVEELISKAVKDLDSKVDSANNISFALRNEIIRAKETSETLLIQINKLDMVLAETNRSVYDLQQAPKNVVVNSAGSPIRNQFGSKIIYKRK